jgi:hypothetical protein
MLYVIQETLRFCSDTERGIDGPYLGGLGKTLLMASDHLYSPIPQVVDSLDKIVQIICSFIPTSEANGLNSYLMKMARSQLMLSRFIEPLRMKRNFFDVHALFNRATGIPLETYQALLFGTLARFGSFDNLRNSNEPANFAIPKTWFRTTSIPVEQIELFLSEAAATSQDLADRITRKKPKGNDFTVLRDKPLLRELEYLFPIDMTFLAEKFDSGPFWRIHNDCLTTKSERDRFHSFWGTVFEGYMNWVLQESCVGKTNRFFRDPRYTDNPDQQVCDAIIVSGRSAILVEYKGSTFTASAKYGGQAEPLKKEMEEKLVGTPEAMKGVRQLIRAVEKLSAFESNKAVSQVDLNEVTTFFPLIIMRDDLGSVFGVNAYLNERFQELRSVKRLWRSITPLFCLSADDIEKIFPYLTDTPLSALLEARYHGDKQLMGSLLLSGNSVLERKGERSPAVLLDIVKAAIQHSAEVLDVKPDASGSSPQSSGC